MSLINDALKKAQRERENPHGSGLTPPPPVAPASPLPPAAAPQSRPWILIVVLVVLVAGATALLTKSLSNRSAEPPLVTAASQPAPPARAPRSAEPTPAPLVVAALDPTPPSSPTPKPHVTILPKRQATPLPTQPPVVTAAGSLEPVRISPAAERARKLLLVNQIRVSGVRISERGNRALINDRLVKVGDTVESIPGLKIVEIEHEGIVFVDDTGHRYTKRLQ
jgi:hypothetical protein